MLQQPCSVFCRHVQHREVLPPEREKGQKHHVMFLLLAGVYTSTQLDTGRSFPMIQHVLTAACLSFHLLTSQSMAVPAAPGPTW